MLVSNKMSRDELAKFILDETELGRFVYTSWDNNAKETRYSRYKQIDGNIYEDCGKDLNQLICSISVYDLSYHLVHDETLCTQEEWEWSQIK